MRGLLDSESAVGAALSAPEEEASQSRSRLPEELIL